MQKQAGSATALALTGVGLTLPAVFNAVIGVYVDRWRRLRTMIVCDAVRFAIIGGLFAAVSQPGLVGGHIIAVVVGLVTLSEVFGQLFGLAIVAFVPSLVPEQQLPEANGLLATVAEISTLLGFGFGGVIIDRLGVGPLFAANAASFLVSAALLGFLKPQSQPPAPPEANQGFVAEFVSGLRFVWRETLLRYSVLLMFAVNVVAAPLEVLLTTWSVDVVHLPSTAYSLYFMAMSAGSLLGGILVIKPLNRLVGVYRLLVLGAVGQGVSLFGFSSFTPLWFGLIALVVFGLWNACAATALMSWLQLSTPPHLRGRVFGSLGTLLMAGQPVGMALSGVLSATMSVRQVFVVCSAVFLLSGLGLALLQGVIRPATLSSEQSSQV